MKKFKTNSVLAIMMILLWGAAYSLPKFPIDKTAENDLKSNWKVQGTQGVLLSVKKEGKWERKVIVKQGVKLTIAYIKFSVKVDFDQFIRIFNASAVYILDNNEWIYDKNEILNWKDEAKDGSLPSKEEIKKMIQESMEQKDQKFLDKISDYQNVEKINSPVKVSKVLITKPEVRGNTLVYYADIDFSDSSGNQFLFENMKVDIMMKDKDLKNAVIVLRALPGVGKCTKK